ncbi:hypothetical protein D3C84_762970 [compost metagenome]
MHRQHQRLIGLGQGLQRRRRFPLFQRLAVDKTHQRQLFGKGGQLVGQLALAVEHLGATIEYQFVLTTDLIEVNQRQAGLLATLGHQLAADPGFLLIVWGGIDGEQQLGTGRLCRESRARLPQIFADEQAQLVATERHHASIARRGEVTLLVEHPVVGQILLEVTGDELALLIERGCIVERFAFAPGVSHQNGATTLPGRDTRQGRLHPYHQIAAQQQIFRGIAGQRQLGADQQIGALLVGLCGGSQHLVTVIFDGAYRQI